MRLVLSPAWSEQRLGITAFTGLGTHVQYRGRRPRGLVQRIAIGETDMAKPVKKGKGPAKLTKKTQSPVKNLYRRVRGA